MLSRVIAIVHDSGLCNYPGIEYRTYPEAAQGGKALRKCLSKRLYWDSHLIAEQDDKPVDLWISFDDTTPSVEASVRVLFCTNADPALKSTMRDWINDYQTPMRVRRSTRAYKRNIHDNTWIITRQAWLRRELTSIFKIDPERVIVFPPRLKARDLTAVPARKKGFTFFYPAPPQCHKNAELICEAARLLELEIGRSRFSVELTILGNENKYAYWVKSNWSQTDSIHFNGVLSPEKIQGWYDAADCLIYSSRNESWATNVAEFMGTEKPMLLIDKPYAREAAGGASQVAFFPDGNPMILKEQMKSLVIGDSSRMSFASFRPVDDPAVYDWDTLFARLLA